MPHGAPYPYVRHRPVLTLLYQVMDHRLPEYLDHIRDSDPGLQKGSILTEPAPQRILRPGGE